MKLRKIILAAVLAIFIAGIPAFANDALGWTVTTPNPKTHRGASYWIP